MGSYKPRSKAGRLPTNYGDEPRKRRPSEKFDGDAGAVLAMTPMTEQERVARAERALAVLRSYGAEDIAEALGLFEVGK